MTTNAVTRVAGSPSIDRYRLIGFLGSDSAGYVYAPCPHSRITCQARGSGGARDQPAER